MYDENTKFDEGVVINEGGYNLHLKGWRDYYTTNVLLLHAISHAQFCKEFPNVANALTESDRKLREWKESEKLNAQLAEVIKRFGGIEAFTEKLTEAFPPVQPVASYQPNQPKMPEQGLPTQKQQVPVNPPGQEAPQSTDAPSQSLYNHTHNMQCDANGDGETDQCAIDGHSHAVKGGQIMAANNHTHEVQAQKQAPQQPQQPIPQGQPQSQPMA